MAIEPSRPVLLVMRLQFACRRHLHRFLGVTRLHAFAIRLNPDLQQVHGLVFRRVEFAVLHAGAGGHVLDFAGLDDAAVAHGILVLELRRSGRR